MKEAAELGELALKLEKYRYNIITALSWPIFGMVMSSAVLLINSLYLVGDSLGIDIPPYIWILLIPAAIASGIVFGRLMKYTPYREKKWRKAVVTMFLPFFIAYIIPGSPFYYTIAWYPALGIAMLLTGILIERKSEYIVANSMTLVGLLILATSSVLLLMSKLPASKETMIATGLVAIAMMLVIYLLGALYGFSKAQRVIYGT